MIYLIFGSEIYLIDKKIKEISNKNKDADIVKVDASIKGFNYKQILESCMDVGLFASRSVVLVKDPLFLKKKIEDKNVDELIEYCSKPIYENDLVFYTYDNDFKKVLKSYKDIVKNAKVFECNANPKTYYVDCLNIVKEKDLVLDKKVLNILIDSCSPSLTLFNQNLDVLCLYPDKLDEDVTKRLITSNNEENVFNLINALTKKNISSAIKSLNKIISNDNNINGLIALLASQLRFLYEVSYYNEKSYSINEIMEYTGVKNRYRIDKAFETLDNLNMKEIINLLSKLADLDYQSKTSSDLNDKLKMELFIVSLI